MLRSRRLNRHGQAGSALYRSAVAAARQPYFYAALNVPDTLDGRFDLVALHAFLLVQRLQDAPEPGPSLAQAVFDAMFSDMDSNLREIGVGDLSVGKRVRTMWEAFHGRSKTYAEALGSGDRLALAAALGRNVWRGVPPEGSAEALAGIVMAQAACLRSQALDAFAAGTVRFPPVEEIAR